MKVARALAVLAVALVLVSAFLFARVFGCSELGCVLVAPASLCMFLAFLSGVAATVLAKRARKRGPGVFHS